MVNPIAQALHPLQPFLWGRGGAQMTPEQIAREREIAEALGAVDTSPVDHWLQGAARMANAAVGRIKEGRANRAEQDNATYNQDVIAGLLGGTTPASIAPELSSGFQSNPAQTTSAATIPTGERADYIRQGLLQRGLPPHVADAFILNFQDESGLDPGINERNPIVPGSRGGFGLYQLTGPRRREYEAFAAQRGTPLDDIDAQLDFLMQEGQGSERQAFERILAAPDTATAAQAIVNDFLRPAPEHRRSRANRYSNLASPASSPAGGVLEALASGSMGVPVAETEADILAQEAAMAQQDPAAFAPQEVAGNPVAAALTNLPVNPDMPMAGNTSGFAPVQQQAGGINPAIIQALSDPRASEQTRQIAGLLLNQQMQAQDPMRQLEMQKMQRELSQGQPLINAGGGQLYDPNSGQWISAPNAGQQQPTSLMQNLMAAGLQPGTPEFRDAIIQNVTKPQTQVNMAGEKAWDQESAKLFAKRYDDISAGAMNAQQMMGMYDLAEQALNSGVRTGLGAEAELTLRQMGAAMGMDTDPEKLAGGELIRAVQNRMALTMRSPDGGMGMPGALSDRDIKFLKDSQIGIDRSPEGNRRMLEAFRAMENRKIEIARLADDYIAQNGRLDSGFNQMVREYAQANPLFPEVESGGAPQAGQVVDGYRFKGGDPADPNSWERQ